MVAWIILVLATVIVLAVATGLYLANRVDWTNPVRVRITKDTNYQDVWDYRILLENRKFGGIRLQPKLLSWKSGQWVKARTAEEAAQKIQAIHRLDYRSDHDYTV